MPPSKRYLVSLLSMFQPIGVVIASVIAYGTAAKYRCDAKLPACNAVGAGEACCSVSSNIGWRYLVIIIGAMTLSIFFARYLLFRFYESPKFLVAKGREQDAINVLHKIAKFNGAPVPTLTIEDFRDIDRSMGVNPADKAADSDAKGVIVRTVKSLGFLRGLFSTKLGSFTFILLGLAYMVCILIRRSGLLNCDADSRRATTGPSIWLALSCPLFFSVITSTTAPAASRTPTASTCTSTCLASSEQ